MTAASHTGNAPLEVPVVHQALFGYRNGHRLVAASTSFDPRVVDVLNRTTDGTGAETIAGFDGYLSGFPLSDGRYVLARTWKAPEAGRPGAVWTHAVFLDLSGPHSAVHPSKFVEMLRRPHRETKAFDEYSFALEVDTTETPASRQFRSDWTARLSALYSADAGSVWLAASTAFEAEAEVVEVWTWHWPALRRRLSFCLGTLSRRTVGGAPFDILVVPASRSLTAATDLGDVPSTVTPTGTLVAADLHGGMPASFGQFIRFCGAETQRRTAVALLSESWLLAEDPGRRPLVALQALTSRVSKEFPEPAAMRRLKRSLLVREGRLPSPWSATDQFKVLLQASFGSSVLATDAPLNALLEANVGGHGKVPVGGHETAHWWP